MSRIDICLFLLDMNRKDLNKISLLLPEDILRLKELQPEGWPDIVPHYKLYLNLPFCKPLKVVVDREIAGIGCVIFHRFTAWLGHIIVSPIYRNQGIGTKLTATLLEEASKAGYKSVSLIATKLGEPIYTKLGFQKESEYKFFRTQSPLAFNLDENRIRDIDVSSLERIFKLDLIASGEDRSLLLKEFLTEGKVIATGKEIEGFYLPHLNEGLVVANNKDAGVELLKLKVTKKALAIVPEENKEAIQFLEKTGFTLYSTGSRMRFGLPVNFIGEMIFNRIGGNLG